MLNMKQDKCFNKILKMSKDYEHYANGEIIRYNGKHKIKQESMAEHSFIVAINIIKVAKVLDISDNIRNKAVTMGVLHDISEKYIGDIAYEFKSEEQNKPVLDKLFDDYEKKLYKDKYKSEFGEIYKNVYEGSNCVADRLVKLGDSMSVAQYSERESELGNISLDMSNINHSAKNRVKYDYKRLIQAIKESEANIE